jgi:ABC-type transport system involved in cytochrome bd biosynthesis fused ATPase/permease subunit
VINDAVAALERTAQVRMVESLRQASAGRTLIWATQDTASAAQFERVLVFAEQRLVQDGSYDELAARDGQLKELIGT